MLLGEKRATRGRVDPEGEGGKDVKDILKRWQGSAVVEGASNAPVSPWGGREAAEVAGKGKGRGPVGLAKPRFDLESDLLARPTPFEVLRTKYQRGELKKKEMVKQVSDELTKIKKELIESKTRACQAKKERLIGARDEVLAATEQVKKDLEEFKARSHPGEVRVARRAVRANIARLADEYEALMTEHEKAFDEVVKAEKELLGLRAEAARLPTGNPKAVTGFAGRVLRSSTRAVEDLGEKEKEGLRKQLKGEKRALRSLQRH
ncbi:hypothetical protein TWF718_004951 [Orbilia javanica]|uniref:Uncharacterized protein n=1 Tax=Orbilia javanica TaxID=47235 RepID=A0AAN8RFX7_9PEZI